MNLRGKHQLARGRHASWRPGLTLIETMLAVMILSMIMMLVWSGFSQTSKNKARVEAQLDRYHSIRVALERLCHELETAFVSAQQNPSLSLRVTETAFIGKDHMGGDRLDFTSFSHRRLFRDAHESDQNELSYYVTRDPENSEQNDLVRREQNRIDEKPERGGRIEVLIEDVKEFQLEYFDPTTLEWKDEWDTTQAAGQPNRLPAQVKLVLTAYETSADGRRRELKVGTRAAIPIRYGLNHATYNP